MRLPEPTSALAGLAVDALAAHRIVRLIQRDTLPPLARIRSELIGLAGPDSSLTELLVCPWCLGVHVAAATRIARAVAPRWWPRLAGALAAASVVGLITEWEESR